MATMRERQREVQQTIRRTDHRSHASDAPSNDRTGRSVGDEPFFRTLLGAPATAPRDRRQDGGAEHQALERQQAEGGTTFTRRLKVLSECERDAKATKEVGGCSAARPGASTASHGP